MASPQTPEEMEGVVTTPEHPVQPEAAPSPTEAPPTEPEPTPMSETPGAGAPPTASEAEPAVPTELVSQVQELVNFAFQEGATEAIKQARQSGNASLVDALQAKLSEYSKDPKLREKLKLAA